MSVQLRCGLHKEKLQKVCIDDDEKHYLVPWTYGWPRLGQTISCGDQPDIADIYTYGTIRVLHGMDTHTEILEKNEKLRNWYNRMFETVGSSSCTEWK